MLNLRNMVISQTSASPMPIGLAACLMCLLYIGGGGGVIYVRKLIYQQHLVLVITFIVPVNSNVNEIQTYNI
jgi:hypothetical protein